MTDTTATHRNAGTSRTPGSRLFASVPVLSLVPASLGIFLIAGPLLGLFLNIPWSQLGSIFTPQVLGAANLSLNTAAASTLICGLLGAPLALVLSKVLNRSRLHRFGSVLYAIIYTPVILSPVVSGLGLLFFWGRKGMIGTYLYQAGISIPFTPNAVIIAQVFAVCGFGGECVAVHLGVVEAGYIHACGDVLGEDASCRVVEGNRFCGADEDFTQQ